jgi:hypothetical protein
MTASAVSRVTPYVRRLIEDDHVQDQIAEALTELRRSSRRVKNKNAREALTDRRLRSQLQRAAGSLNEAVRALNEPPPPKRHRFLSVVVVAAATGGAAYAWQQRSGGDPGSP